MTEKQTAVAFLEWVENGFLYSIEYKLWFSFYDYKNRHDENNGITSAELFDIFMIQKHYTNGSLNKRATNG